VEAFYKTAQDDTGLESRTESTRLGRPFYERVWLWVSNHTDIRIIHNGGVHQYSLAEFEAAENAETRTNSAAATAQSIDPASTAYKPAPPANSLLGLRDSMRQRLAKEGLYPQTAASITSSTQQSLPLQDLTSARSTDKILQAPHRTPRILPTTGHDGQTIFDDPPTTTTAPRLYASQSRIWQALTGHGIDLKKVPTMEFVLLSLIASHGAAGVTQPDLTVISGQDKRSVPHRTDELCRKGYIEKRPVQAGKLRTSLCVHQKFVSDDHFLTSGKVEDVFQYKKFVVSGFVHLLYNTLKDAGIVPTRDIRKRLVSTFPYNTQTIC
jgi:transcription factor C subunit 3